MGIFASTMQLNWKESISLTKNKGAILQCVPEQTNRKKKILDKRSLRIRRCVLDGVVGIMELEKFTRPLELASSLADSTTLPTKTDICERIIVSFLVPSNRPLLRSHQKDHLSSLESGFCHNCNLDKLRLQPNSRNSQAKSTKPPSVSSQRMT